MQLHRLLQQGGHRRPDKAEPLDEVDHWPGRVHLRSPRRRCATRVAVFEMCWMRGGRSVKTASLCGQQRMLAGTARSRSIALARGVLDCALTIQLLDLSGGFEGS